MPSPWSDPDVLMNLMRSSGLPMPSSMPSATEVRKQAQSLSRDVYSTWNVLNAIVLRREEAFRKRWIKKNRSARTNVLLRAWPDLPTRHRPDFWALAHPASDQHNEKYTNAFKYPYINLEDLTEQKSLLLLLNSRARNPPSLFAHSDVETWHVGRIKGIIRPLFLNEHTMYLAGQDTSATYGRLVSWDDDEDAFDLMHKRLQFQPGEGILAIEAELTVLSFLVKCCQEVFPDMSLDELKSSNVPLQPEPPALLSQDTAYAQLSNVTAEAPYRAPCRIDFEALKTLVTARRAAAEDHIWDLREDPGYFAYFANALSDNTSEQIYDSRGKLHPNSDDDLFWQRILLAMPVNAYATFLVWDQILDRITAVLDSMPTRNLDPGAPLPKRLEIAFLELRHALKKCVDGVIHDLKGYVPGSPGFRSMFVRETSQYGTTKMNLQSRSIPAAGSVLQLMNLIWDDQQRFLYGLSNLVDEMQRLVDKSREERDKFSPVVTATFSNLALMSHISHQVNTFFPWSAGFEELEVDFESSKQQHEIPDFQLIGEMGTSPPTLVKLVVPFSQKLQYPASKTQNEANVEMMREAEANLDRYWKQVDEHIGKNGNALNDMLKRHGASVREIQRTPEYSPPVTTEDIEKDHKSLGETETQLQTLNFNDTTIDVPRRAFVQPINPKLKTRGGPSFTKQVQTPTIDQKRGENLEPTIDVSKRAFKVFQHLFHSPRSVQQQQQQATGEIPWTDFLHAMGSAGCSIEKLYGSVWQFVPKQHESFGWHGIHFHEPHPSSKISPMMARRIGRRLSRNYGWSGVTFKAVGTSDV